MSRDSAGTIRNVVSHTTLPSPAWYLDGEVAEWLKAAVELGVHLCRETSLHPVQPGPGGRASSRGHQGGPGVADGVAAQPLDLQSS